MSQRFVRKVTVLRNGQVEVERQIPALNHVFDPPEIGQGTRAHVVVALQDLVSGFYTGNKAWCGFVGQAIHRGFVRDPQVSESIIAFEGGGDLQFFANFRGMNIDLAARCGLYSITALCVDKEQGRLFVGGSTIEGADAVIMEVGCATALPMKIWKVGDRARSVEWSAARDGAVVVVLDNGVVKVLRPGSKHFERLPAGKNFLAKKVFPGGQGFYFSEVSGDIFSLDVDSDGVELGIYSHLLDPGEELLCVVQDDDDKDLLVIMSYEGYTFAAAPT